MNHPWIKYRKIGGPIIRITALLWPVTWQGWLCCVGLAVLWLGGGNIITLSMFPEKTKAGGIALGSLALITLGLFWALQRYKGVETGSRYKDED